MKIIKFRDMLFTVIGLAAVFWFSAAAAAQDAEAPLGVHPQGSQAHWYDGDCCNLTDCARIRVRIEDDHYVWDSWRFPGFTVRVPIDPERAAAEGIKVRPSQDGDFHGCESPMSLPPGDGASGSFSAWELRAVTAKCLYVPPAT